MIPRSVTITTRSSTVRVNGGATVAIKRPDAVKVVIVGIQGPAGASNAPPINPVFSYSGGALSRVDYSDGSFKALEYDAGHGDRLDYVDFTRGATTTRKTIAYNGDGTVHAVTASVV